MQIIIGSDHGGYNLKEAIIKHLKESGHDVIDEGTNSTESCDYPVFAVKVAKKVLENLSNLGILVCGTGIGMCICANKIKGIRASNCADTFSARLTRQHNNSNILCLGERTIGQGLALDIVDEWLNSEFDGGRHQRRLDMITKLEMENI